MDTYTIIRVSVEENLPSPLPADIRPHSLKLLRSRIILNLIRLTGNLILEQPARIPPLAQNQLRVRLLRLDNALLDIMMDRRFERAHESRAHVDAFGAEVDSGRETLAVAEAS